MKNIRVLVADDHPVFREGLARLFCDEGGLDCVAIARDGEEAIKLTKKLHPDVVIIDADMPKISGIDAAREIKKTCSDTAVLILSAYKYEHFITAAMQAGVDGYLLKDTPRSELIEAIRMIHSGKGVFSLEATSEVLRKIASTTDDKKSIFSMLRSRELEVLELIAKGMSNKLIAHKLGITEGTVATHLFNVFRKLKVESRTEAALYALKKGLLSIDDIAEK